MLEPSAANLKPMGDRMSNRVFIIVYFVALALVAAIWHFLPTRNPLPPCWPLAIRAVDLASDCSTTLQPKGPTQ
jgi:hypothetical protein